MPAVPPARPHPMPTAVKVWVTVSCVMSGAVVLLVVAYAVFATVVSWGLSSLTW